MFSRHDERNARTRAHTSMYDMFATVFSYANNHEMIAVGLEKICCWLLHASCRAQFPTNHFVDICHAFNVHVHVQNRFLIQFVLNHRTLSLLSTLVSTAKASSDITKKHHKHNIFIQSKCDDDDDKVYVCVVRSHCTCRHTDLLTTFSVLLFLPIIPFGK